MVQLVPHRTISLDQVWAEVLAALPPSWSKEPFPPAMAAAIGIDPTAAMQVSFALSTGRLAKLTLLRNRTWVELVSVLAVDAHEGALTEDECTEATLAWVELGVRCIDGIDVRPNVFKRVEGLAKRLSASLSLHHSDLAVLLRSPKQVAVLHPVAHGSALKYGEPSSRVATTLAALETLVLPAVPDAAVAVLSAWMDAHRERATESVPQRVVTAEDAGAFIAHLRATQRSFDEAAARELFSVVGPGPWYLARRRNIETAVQCVAVRPTLALVLDLEGDGP